MLSMLGNGRVEKLLIQSGYEYDLYEPTLVHQYLKANGAESYPAFLSSIGHRIRNAMCLFGKGYKVLYMLSNGEIVGFLSYGLTSIKHASHRFSNTEYMVRFLWISPKYRGRGLGKELMNTWLDRIGLQYSAAYETILPDNYSSIAVAKACGYKQLGYGTKNRLTGKWTLDSNGTVLVFKKAGNL